MKKQSQFTATWPTAYNLIKELGLMKNLPSKEKIKLDSSLPEQANAFGFVTTEDSDDNGTLDTMHIVVPNIDKHLQGINASELMRLKIEDPNRLKQILMPIVELIAHEQGHQEDYKHGEDNPFPGGEQVADQAAQRAINEISLQATNNINKNDIKRSFVMSKEVISRLVKLAEDLDKKKAYNLSEEVTKVAEKFAQELPRPDLKELGRDAKSMVNAKLYHPDGDMKGERVFTGKVGFNWGQYNGELADQPYYIASDRIELGRIQFPGDPYTYEPAGPGKIKVVSGPEDTRYAIGNVIDDPNAESPSQQPKTAPLAESPAPEVIGVPSSPEYADPASLQLDLERAQKVFNENIQAYSELLKKNLVPDYRISELTSSNIAIPGYDRRLYEIFNGRVPQEIKDATETIKANRLKLRELESRINGSAADDELSSEAGYSADKLTKNASFNAVFWKPNTKTPFGR